MDPGHPGKIGQQGPRSKGPVAKVQNVSLKSKTREQALWGPIDEQRPDVPGIVLKIPLNQRPYAQAQQPASSASKPSPKNRFTP